MKLITHERATVDCCSVLHEDFFCLTSTVFSYTAGVIPGDRVVESSPTITKVTRVIEGQPSITKVTRVIEGQPTMTKVTRVIEGDPTMTKVTRVIEGKHHLAHP